MNPDDRPTTVTPSPAAGNNTAADGDTSSADGDSSPSAAGDSSPAAVRVRYRIRFAKIGLLRWISHRDLAQLWERLTRRAALPLSMTEGFHPKPRIAFPSALALGIESLDEVVEIELSRVLGPGELLRLLRDDGQPGLVIRSAQRLPENAAKARLERSDYRVAIPEDADLTGLDAAVAELRARETVSITRKDKPVVAKVADQIPRLERSRDHLLVSLAAADGATLRPADVLELMGCGDWIRRGSKIVRTRVVLRQEYDPGGDHDIAYADPDPNARHQPTGGE